MEKDFDNWTREKRRIHHDETDKLYHEREVWWCALGINIGYEQDGTGTDYQRPVLILKGLSASTCYIAPLTTSAKQHRYRIPVGTVDGREAKALISQIRLIDTKRLVNKVGYIEPAVFAAIRKAAKELL